jgi:hypothetical protein
MRTLCTELRRGARRDRRASDARADRDHADGGGYIPAQRTFQLGHRHAQRHREDARRTLSLSPTSIWECCAALYVCLRNDRSRTRSKEDIGKGSCLRRVRISSFDRCAHLVQPYVPGGAAEKFKNTATTPSFFVDKGSDRIRVPWRSGRSDVGSIGRAAELTDF